MDNARRQHVVGVVIIVNRQPDLLQIIFALCPASSFARLLNCRKQKSDQNGDNGNHNQQLNQRKSGSARHGRAPMNEAMQWKTKSPQLTRQPS